MIYLGKIIVNKKSYVDKLKNSKFEKMLDILIIMI